MINDWLRLAHPGRPWVCAYVFSWVSLILWAPFAALIVVIVWGLAGLPDFMEMCRVDAIGLAADWADRPAEEIRP